MKIHIIGALLASAAFSAPAFAADTAVVTVDTFCTQQRLTPDAQAECSSKLRAATTEAERTVIMDRYRGSLATSPPLRNDLTSNEAGVKNADQPTQAVTGTVVTAPPPASSSSSVTVVPQSGTSVTTGSPTPGTTSALVCADARLSVKEQDDCSKAMSMAATDLDRITVTKRYEARVATTPLRNDLRSNDAGVKGAEQPIPKD